MKRPHPATLIVLGVATIVAASSRDGLALFLGASGLILLALTAAASHACMLARRSRWLLLVMLVMFGWFTPGTSLPFIPGASQEGLVLAAENIARLLIALSVVALMLDSLAIPDLVAGIRSLLEPLVLLKVSPDRIAVRLALTLNEVESSRQGIRGETEQQAGTLVLPVAGFGVADSVAGALAGLMIIGAWLA